ncbi:MAG: hypothetical protein Q7R53_02740 [bacterium]|nr:hypothetical protein [bacterium]
MNNNNHGGGFLNGLLWGAVIGGGLVFLLGTKKGKKIIKVVSEGLGDVSDIGKLLEEDEIEDYEEEPVSLTKKRQEKTSASSNGEYKSASSEESIEEDLEKPQPESVNSSPHRLFRGIPRRR